MSSQFEVAFSTLVDFYGEPKWEENPKVGQSREQIIKIWESELKDYSESQVREACYKLFRFRKAMTFPTISHLMAMLYDEEKQEKKHEAYKSEKCSCPEFDLYDECGRPCLFGYFRYAFQKMVEDFIAYNPEAQNLTFSTGLASAMRNNGWWNEKIGEYLKC